MLPKIQVETEKDYTRIKHVMSFLPHYRFFISFIFFGILSDHLVNISSDC